MRDFVCHSSGERIRDKVGRRRTSRVRWGGDPLWRAWPGGVFYPPLEPGGSFDLGKSLWFIISLFRKSGGVTNRSYLINENAMQSFELLNEIPGIRCLGLDLPFQVSVIPLVSLLGLVDLTCPYLTWTFTVLCRPPRKTVNPALILRHCRAGGVDFVALFQAPQDAVNQAAW